MVNSDKEQQLNRLKSKMIKVQVIEAPGSILFGLGVYGKFVANGEAFIPFLNDSSNVNACLILGGALMAWGMYQIFKTGVQIKQLQKAD